MAALRRPAYLLAREIIEHPQTWRWDHYNLDPQRLNVHSLATAALPWLGRGLRVDEMRGAWRVAVERTHAALQDGWVRRNAEGYVISVWREELRTFAERTKAKGGPTSLTTNL
jgi:hypothetical protein